MLVNNSKIINLEEKSCDQSYNVAIVGSNRLSREILLESFPSSVRFIQSKSLCDVIKKMDSKNSFNVIILIIESEKDFSENIIPLKKFHDSNKICKSIILSAPLNSELISEALKAGVSTFLSQEISMHAMHKTIDFVRMGHSLISITQDFLLLNNFSSHETSSLPNEEHAALLPQICTSTFTPREQEICNFLKNGYSNKDIANSLKIAEATVKIHIKALLRKTGLKNRTQAAVWSIAQNFKK